MLKVRACLGVVLLFLATDASVSTQANPIALENARTQPGEYFPRALYKQHAPCSERLDHPVAVMDDFQQKWFSAHLAAAQEQPLPFYWSAGDNTIVRFLWLPSFNHSVVVRVIGSPESGGRIEAKRLSGAGGYAPGQVVDHVDRELTADEWRRIKSSIDRTDLFEQPPETCDLGLDGSEWVIEAIDHDGYHFLKRWTPQKGAVRKVGLLLLKLTGWHWKADDLY
jgi:hypothetical protein